MVYVVNNNATSSAIQTGLTTAKTIYPTSSAVVVILPKTEVYISPPQLQSQQQVSPAFFFRLPATKVENNDETSKILSSTHRRYSALISGQHHTNDSHVIGNNGSATQRLLLVKSQDTHTPESATVPVTTRRTMVSISNTGEQQQQKAPSPAHEPPAHDNTCSANARCENDDEHKSKGRRKRFAAASRSFFARLRKRFKPVSPAPNLDNSISSPSATINSETKKNENPEMVRNQHPNSYPANNNHHHHHPPYYATQAPPTSQQRVTNRRCDQSNADEYNNNKAYGSVAGKGCNSDVQVATTIVEVATRYPAQPQQSNQQCEQPASYYSPNSCGALPNATSNSSGFYSGSSYTSNNRFGPQFSPTTDDLASSDADQYSQTCHDQRIPTSRSCPFPEALASDDHRPARLLTKTSKSPSSGKRQPPLVKFNRLGDISPTVKKPILQKSCIEEENSSSYQTQRSDPALRNVYEDEEYICLPQQGRVFIPRNRQPSRLQAVPQSATMPSLNETRGYESDDGLPKNKRETRRSGSLSSVIRDFLKRKTSRKASSRSVSPRIASPVGPRRCPSGREPHAGFQCGNSKCHCHIFPEAKSNNMQLFRPHLLRNSPSRQTVPRPAGRQSRLAAANGHLPPMFLRGYGPNAPDDPAPEFHCHAALEALEDEFDDDDDDVIFQPSKSKAKPVAKSTPNKPTINGYSNGTGTKPRVPPGRTYAESPRTAAKSKTLPSKHTKSKPPPIVTFVQDECEEDLLYNDGDLIQSVRGSESTNNSTPPPEAVEIRDRLIDNCKDSDIKGPVLYPRSPDLRSSRNQQRMPIVFLPAYPSRTGKPTASAQSSVSSYQNGIGYRQQPSVVTAMRA